MLSALGERAQDGRFLWMFQTRRYELIDDQQLQEVKLRIATLLFDDAIPELRRAEPRIRQISKLDLIGRTMRQTIVELQTAIAGMGLIYH